MSTTFNYTTGSAPAHPMAQGSRSHFSPRRFWHVLRRDLMENPRRDLRALIGVTLGGFALMYLVFWGMSKDVRYGVLLTGGEIDREFMASILHSMASPLLVFFWSTLTYLLSTAFSNLRSKQGRISSFMLPATNLEKFLSRVAKYFLVGGIALVGCIVVADVLRWAVMSVIMGNGLGLVTPYFLDELFTFGLVPVKSCALADLLQGLRDMYVVLITCVFFLSFYLLGAMVFRKQSFILTSLTLLAGMVLLGVVVSRRMVNGISIEAQGIFDDNIGSLYMPVATFWMAFNVWLTYRLFKRASVIPGQGILH